MSEEFVKKVQTVLIDCCDFALEQVQPHASFIDLNIDSLDIPLMEIGFEYQNIRMSPEAWGKLVDKIKDNQIHIVGDFAALVEEADGETRTASARQGVKHDKQHHAFVESSPFRPHFVRGTQFAGLRPTSLIL